jgi:hypothetical protein
MTAMPPSRWKVVEQGRRLVVIDTLTGQPATRAPVVPADGGHRRDTPPAAKPVEAANPSDVDDASGAAVWTTSRLYDLKGPRRIVMTEASAQQGSKRIGGWIIATMAFVVAAFVFPLLWAVPVLALLQPRLRLVIRQAITARLDEIDR